VCIWAKRAVSWGDKASGSEVSPGRGRDVRLVCFLRILRTASEFACEYCRGEGEEKLKKRMKNHTHLLNI
jgi:hypothetical protein